MRTRLVTLVLLAAASAPAAADPAAPEIRVVAVGDIMTHHIQIEAACSHESEAGCFVTTRAGARAISP